MARGGGTPVTAGRRRERHRARGWRGVPQPGPLALPRCLCLSRVPPPRGTLGRGSEGRLACCSRGLQQLHPLLQLPYQRLQVPVAGLGLLELTAGQEAGR